MEQELTQRNERNPRPTNNSSKYSPKRYSSQRKDKFTNRKRGRDNDNYEDSKKRDDNRHYYKSNKYDAFSYGKYKTHREKSHDYSRKKPNINVDHFNFRKFIIKIHTLNLLKIVKIYIEKITHLLRDPGHTHENTVKRKTTLNINLFTQKTLEIMIKIFIITLNMT
jgi:hypothetical protein